ncbi:MAG: hypothetical protein ACI8R1_002035 [Psychrobacter glaciei]|jgi:hypothetical protein|uniref:hypothetical protein n=1 Tax=Psychrobacter glaciei TaxID=619771 RepID=UPI0039E237C1|tara:strand:+ start:22 stop:495 length:474 start_codon:yes stop_codon:yes gene_type:complete
MTAFNMNKPEIEQAAIEFKKALINWKSREKIVRVASIHRPDWAEKDILCCIEVETRRIKPVIEAFEPIYRLAVQGKIEKPFALQSYMMSYTGRVLGDELSWPEVREPYQRMINSLKGGLTTEELIDSIYYRNNLLPEHYDQAVKEIVAEGWTHNYPQ